MRTIRTAGLVAGLLLAASCAGPRVAASPVSSPPPSARSLPSTVAPTSAAPGTSPRETSPRGCAGFALSLASDRDGEPTPLEAAHRYVDRGGAGLPRTGWRVETVTGHEATLRSGRSTLHAVQGPDATWQVDAGETC